MKGKNTKPDHYPSRFLVIIVFEKKARKKTDVITLPFKGRNIDCYCNTISS
jgi:hypothetical protein